MKLNLHNCLIYINLSFFLFSSKIHKQMKNKTRRNNYRYRHKIKKLVNLEMSIQRSKKYNLVERRDKKGRLASIYIVHVSGFVFALGYSVVFTGLFAYLHQVFFYMLFSLHYSPWHNIIKYLVLFLNGNWFEHIK